MTCRWCGAEHGPLCPYVKAIEYGTDGVTITRVEFLTPADFRTARHDDDAGPDYPRKEPS